MGNLLSKNDLILFYGDSVTDCGRKRDKSDDLGAGYALMTAGWLAAQYPHLNLQFLNRGIGGDRTSNLLRRSDTDLVQLKPTVVSIFIGINNTWRRYDDNDATSVELFTREYDTLLKRISNELKAKIVLMDPFVLPFPEDRKAWREDLDPKIEAIHKLAKTYNAMLVPIDKIMNDACTLQSPAYWTADGVHPTPAGHALIAQTWIKYVVG
jgi:lysophospholipase L1-like esterase